MDIQSDDDQLGTRLWSREPSIQARLTTFVAVVAIAVLGAIVGGGHALTDRAQPDPAPAVTAPAFAPDAG